MRAFLTGLVASFVASLLVWAITHSSISALAAFLLLALLAAFGVVAVPHFRIRQHGGVLDAYSQRNACIGTFARLLETSLSVDMLLINGSRLLTFEGSPLLPAMKKRTKSRDPSKELRVLLLDPKDTDDLGARIKGLGDTVETHERLVNETVRRLDEIASEYDVSIQIRLYSEPPVFSILTFDEEVFVTVYLPGLRACATPTYRLRRRSVLCKGLMAYFEQVWARAQPVADAQLPKGSGVTS